MQSSNIATILKGGYDLHVHPEPDLIERSGDDFTFAKMAVEAGMAGIALKSHYFPTVERAKQVRKFYPGFEAIGGLCLNNYVGGLNPLAVEVFARAGGKIVWMPTVDSYNEYIFNSEGGVRQAHYWSKMQDELRRSGVDFSPIKVLESNGKLGGKIQEVLEVMLRHNLILATGHLSPSESITLIENAYDLGMRRFIITHPEAPSTFFDLDQQKYLIKFGVFFERSYRIPAINLTTWEYFFSEIKETSEARNVLATDLGQKDSVPPVVGMKELIVRLMEAGFSAQGIRRMLVGNYRFLLGKEVEADE
ncbi:MAG: DUF6282 family protein [Thermoplasmataceae archaeon]